MKKGVYYKLFITTIAYLIQDICLSFIILLHLKLNILIAIVSTGIFSLIVAEIIESIFNKNYDSDDNYNIQFLIGLIIFIIVYIFMLLQIW